MVCIYNLIIRTYYLLVGLFSTFNSKASLWLRGRRDWEKRLAATINPNYSTVWFHCASLGEFEQGRPLIEAYRQKYPEHKILITFFSPSGYEVRKNYSGADYIFYLPLDTHRNAKRFISIVNPILAVFIKYEFWHHFLNELKNKNIPTYLASAIFRPDQIFFKTYGFWNRRMLYCFNHIFVQNPESQQLIQTIGIENVTVTGDTRFDRVYATAELAEKLPLLHEFCEGSTIIVAGSTWPRDEELLFSYIRNAQPAVKLIIAPHEIDEHRIQVMQRELGISSIRYQKQRDAVDKNARVLIIDAIGYLASAYRYGQIAYVGGGFGIGIHNTLEPAAFGIPVVFGPNYHKFREAKELINQGAGFSISSQRELLLCLDNLINSPQNIKNAGLAAKKYVLENIGATQRVLNLMGV